MRSVREMHLIWCAGIWPKMVSHCLFTENLLIQELSGPNSEQDQAGVVSEPRPHPLFRAAVISGSDQLVQMHIARGRDVNSRDESGTSLLGLAAGKGHLGTFKLLLEAGANPAVKDLQGKDPLEIARANGHVKIVELLSELNAVVRPAASILETVPESDAAVESDGGFWVAEASPSEPAGDPEYVSRAAANETRITDFEYLNPDEDWDDVYADLPTYQAFAGIRKQEFHVLRSELIGFFGSAIVSGTVLNDQITALGDDGDEFDEEARECIGRMLDELGIEVLEGIDPEIIPSAPDDLSDAESEMAEDATAYFGDLWSPVQDSYWLFMRDMGRAKLLSVEDEIWLAEAIERSWLSITREVCSNVHALTILCAVTDKISNRELPPGYLLASHTDFRDELITAALDDSPDSDELESRDFDTASEESVPITEDDDWESTVHKLKRLSQEGTTTAKPQFDVEVGNQAFALLREIRFSEQFVRFLIAELQSDDNVTDLASAETIGKILSEYEGFRNRFAEANLRLVHSIARTHAYRGADLLDLVQEGSLGLLKAVDRFDHRRGFKFSTYATWWIKQSIMRAIADKSRTIRIPVHVVEKINKVLGVLRRWKNDDMDNVDAGKIAAELEMPVEKVKQLIDLSCQTTATADLTQEIIDSLVDYSASTAWRSVMDGDLRSKASKVLRTLTPRERSTIVKRFGLEGEDEHTLEEVGHSIGVTRERIRQIEAKALRKLRHPVRKRILEPFLEVSI